ncbi:glycosyltransferase family 4 protein [Caballeronia sp. LZ062]|uniref:glycosyltransferase family 4 protein n=1 Tax=unclassified Caballeronia TaxID=2646786 RepID=UPI00285F3ADF|nr:MULTISPECIES: glycosyltransferase family 4 protein [unclassified Caballeronia]MDR5855106.1 glycosyltransferase family 4 protein [Caballeronia sp. LZ050]MDR5870364.1 glycosyltransferase family 4 protein [Caballeronia sp. LZ062]
MRILQVILAPRLSGAEVLAKGVAIGHQRAGHSVSIASLMPEHDDFRHISAELRAHGVSCVFPAKNPTKLGRLLFLHRAIRSFKPDIIFAHATIPALYVRALPTRVPIVWVMHSGANDFANAALMRAERLLSNRAKAVIGVSQKNIDDYVKEIGLHPSMIVVPNGVDVSRFADDAGPRVPVAHKQIVQVGRYIPEKNQLQTVDAFAHVARADRDARLLLCGVVENLDYHAAVVERVAQLGLKDRVSIQGPQQNVAQILRASTVFAMPSSFEAHSIGFLEALASGIPVVGNAIASFAFAGGFPGVQLLDTSDTAAYGRALLEALSQPRATRPLQGLTLQSTADRYLAIARDVLDLRVGLT